MTVIRASLQHSKMHLVSHRTGWEQDLIWFLLLSARFTSSPSAFLLATRSPSFLAHQSNQIEAMRERICHFHIFWQKLRSRKSRLADWLGWSIVWVWAKLAGIDENGRITSRRNCCRGKLNSGSEGRGLESWRQQGFSPTEPTLKSNLLLTIFSVTITVNVRDVLFGSKFASHMRNVTWPL